ncbi:unnamed protein product [Didymodactylos carnosus]|uniref:F-box domain-containing protein n=1 Tax=Didymodactylos carnosus TaxID=1234261 RepID=A0A815Q713_9BILA|nr:unnamed protein product [Didymodactylos carnosus]CAF4329128.1 unnamed protein product [Didymodactylos carnosus]
MWPAKNTQQYPSQEISTLESSLPNELYDFIFLYLKAIDIIYSFFNLNGRFNNLIYPFLCAVDLSNVDERTLNKCCQTILPKIHHYIKAIKVDDKNIDSIFPLSLYSKIYPNLESVFITKVKIDGKYLSYLKLFKQLLNLKIYFDTEEINKTVSNELCLNLFQSACRLETLFFDQIYVPINTHFIQLCFSVRKLTIKVLYFHHIYILLNKLPSIESVNIAMPCVASHRQQQLLLLEKYIEFNYNQNIPSTLSKLKHFVFYAVFNANYDYLELLLSHCCPNVEYLSLKVYINQFIDGERLEKMLLSKLTKLKVFHFCFRIPVVDSTLNIDDYIQTYKSSYWIDNNHSILCFNQPLHRRYCVFSLPFMFDKFCFVSNDLVNYRSNVNDDILLYSKQNKADMISFSDDTVPYTFELFQIIQKSFPRATELMFEAAHVRCLSDNILHNELVMENIVTVTYMFKQLEFKYFRRLLLLTPNIQTLYILESLVLDVLRKSEDSSFQQLQSACSRIRCVGIGKPSFEYDAVNDYSVKVLFPNAELFGEWR